MNALVSTIPARTVGRDHTPPTFLDILRGVIRRAILTP